MKRFNVGAIVLLSDPEGEFGGPNVPARVLSHGRDASGIYTEIQFEDGRKLETHRDSLRAAVCCCTKVCDCQAPDAEPALVSNECPVHNLNPKPHDECPVHQFPEQSWIDSYLKLEAERQDRAERLANPEAATISNEFIRQLDG